MRKNLLDLKRKEIRKIISYMNEKGELEEIKIFNPNPQNQDEIKNIILSYSEKAKGSLKVNIPSEIVMSQILTKATDLEIPKNAKEKEIIEVINDPSIPLQKVMAEVLLLILDLGEIGVKFISFIDNITKLTGIKDEEMLKLMKKVNKENIEPKEKVNPKRTKKTIKGKENGVIDIKEVKVDEEI